MLKKMLVLASYLLIISVSLEAQEKIKMYIYDMEVNIQSTKVNGKPWDISGGAPDFIVSIDGERLATHQRCRNKYKCTVSFISNKSTWYFENYDRDITSHDLIGKGTCSLNIPCKLGQSSVMIKKREVEI